MHWLEITMFTSPKWSTVILNFSPNKLFSLLLLYVRYFIATMDVKLENILTSWCTHHHCLCRTFSSSWTETSPIKKWLLLSLKITLVRLNESKNMFSKDTGKCLETFNLNSIWIFKQEFDSMPQVTGPTEEGFYSESKRVCGLGYQSPF